MLEVGKLDSDLLQRIVIDKITYRRPEVLTRAGIGEDCAVMDFGTYECVVSTDPITASVADVGRLAIHISCNDIASNGIEPLGITLAVMLPEGTTEEDIEGIMTQAGEASKLAGVEIIGGHTEITRAVNQPVIVSTAIGRGVSGASQKAADMKVGDCILMTKNAGLEGTGIAASECREKLSGVLSEEEFTAAGKMLDRVSVIREGVIAGGIGTHGMHDVTEGGILGAAWEMCHIAGLGVEIIEEDIPVDPVTVKICEHFGADWMRLISSGCMLIIADPEKTDEIMEAVTEAGVRITCIGRVKPAEDGLYLVKADGTRETIAPPEADELYKIID